MWQIWLTFVEIHAKTMLQKAIALQITPKLPNSSVLEGGGGNWIKTEFPEKGGLRGGGGQLGSLNKTG